ncbi:MAG: TonB-dependent receptor [Crocinitomicaceae bacterium]
MNRLIFIFLFIVQSFAVNAQGRGDIYGQIINSSTKEKIPFAKILIQLLNLNTASDLNGEFSFKNIPFNEYTILIDIVGYDTITSALILDRDSLNVVLKLNSNQTLLNIVTVNDNNQSTFSSTRKMRPIEGVLISKGKKTEVISLEQMNLNKSVNIGRQIYSRIPGLNIWESDGAGIQLGIGGRGLSPTRTSNFNTRQNGYDISADALGYPESYYTPPTEAIKEIQLIRGAASLQFGTQFGGLLNFVLKKGSQNKALELVARHTFGSFGLNSSFISVGGTKKTWNYYGYYQYKFGNDWKPHSKFKLHSAGLQIEKYLTDKSKLTLDLTKMYYLTQQPGGVTDQQFQVNPSIVNRERNWFEVDWNLAALSYDYEFNSRTRFNTRFFGLLASRKATGFLGQINRIDPLEERNLISGLFKNFGNETRFLKIYDFKEMSWAYLVGFRYYKGYNKSQQGMTSDGSSADFNFANTNFIDGSLYEFPSQNFSIFFEHIFNINSKFSITPGLRFEQISTLANGQFRNTIFDLAGNSIFDTLITENRSNNRAFIIGGIGLNYKINDTIELYSNFSQNYRSINFTDMQIVNPNFRIDPSLEDETGFNFDVGLKGGIKNKLVFDISAFALLYNNRIGTTIQEDSLLFSTYQYRTNISKSITKGIEAVIEFELLDIFIQENEEIDLSLFFNVAYVDAKYFQSEETAFENKKVELVPPFTLKTGLGYKYKRFSASYQYTYTASHFSDATNSKNQANAVNGIIPSYQVMDLSIKYAYKQFQIESGINNLINSSYFTRRASAYPGPGIIASAPRSIYATLQIKL